MKIISLIFALLITTFMVSCSSESKLTATVSQDTTQPSESYTEVIREDAENPYIYLKNYFAMPLEDAGITIEKDNPDHYIDTWGDVNGSKSLRIAMYSNDIDGLGVISNEDYSRNKILWIDIFNPDKEQFEKFLESLDWNPDTSEDRGYPHGYIVTEDSVLIVNSTNYYENYDFGYETIYEIYNTKALADVMGIDIQNAVTKCDSIEDAYDIVYYLENSLYYGVRGYKDYLMYPE